MKEEEELTWNYEYKPLWQGKPFIHGHNPVDAVTHTKNGININTSCGYGGYLTGLHICNDDQEKLSSYIIQVDGLLI